MISLSMKWVCKMISSAGHMHYSCCLCGNESERLQDAGKDTVYRETYDLAVARAVAEMRVLGKHLGFWGPTLNGKFWNTRSPGPNVILTQYPLHIICF